MGCNTSKGGIQAGNSRDGWTLVRSLSRSWSMPYHSSQVQNSAGLQLTSSAYGALGGKSFPELEEEEEDDCEENGPGEVIDPFPINAKQGRPSNRVRVPDQSIDLCVKRRKRSYQKSASLPHIPPVFKPESELVHGLPLVLEDKVSSPNLVRKSTEKPRRPPLPPASSSTVRKGLFYLGREDHQPLIQSPSLKVPDASSNGYHTPQEHLENSSPSASYSVDDDEGWCLINRKLANQPDDSMARPVTDCLRDKTNIKIESINLRNPSSASSSFISRSLLEGFERKCPPGGQDKVVFYSTSLQGIRKTFEHCRSVRMILEGLFTRIDERDVSMHAEFRQELKSLLGSSSAGVPRVFIKGRYIGGMEEVMQLNESGMIRQMVEGIPKERVKRRCAGCGGVRFIPCLECSGSCKVVGEDDEIVRCWDCNENGLVRCPVCCSD